MVMMINRTCSWKLNGRELAAKVLKQMAISTSKEITLNDFDALSLPFGCMPLLSFNPPLFFFSFFSSTLTHPTPMHLCVG